MAQPSKHATQVLPVTIAGQTCRWLTTTCRHCALPLNDQVICGSCLTHPLVRGLAVVPLLHEAEAQYLVAQLKFHKGYREGKTLAACMANRVEHTYVGTSQPSALVATPLSYLSLVRRGYNQSALLAQTLAKTFGIELIAPLTKKTDTTPTYNNSSAAPELKR